MVNKNKKLEMIKLDFNEEIRKTAEEITELLIKKNKGYGNSFYDTLDLIKESFKNEESDSMDYVHYIGFFQRIHDKLKRFLNLISTNDKDKRDKLKDQVFDIIGYSILFYNYIKLEELLDMEIIDDDSELEIDG
jgi:hypothetical protein